MKQQEVEFLGVARRPVARKPPRSRGHQGTYQFDNYSCPHCGRKFSAKSGLKIHVGIAHKGAKLLFCPRCPGSFSDVQSCKAHLKEEHGAKRRSRKVEQEQEQEAPKRSLVPTNESVEGQEIGGGLEEEVGHLRIRSPQELGKQLTPPPQPPAPIATPAPEERAKEASPVKPKPRRPIPALVSIHDLDSLPVLELAKKPGQPLAGTRLQVPKQQLREQQQHRQEQHQQKQKQQKQSLLKQRQHPKCTVMASPRSPPPLMPTATTSPPPLVPASTVPALVPATSTSTTQVTIQAKLLLQLLLQLLLLLLLLFLPQVYVPALTSTGTTILMRLEEAQHHMQRGSVTFLPSQPQWAGAGAGATAAAATGVAAGVVAGAGATPAAALLPTTRPLPILGPQQQILLAPRATLPTSPNIMRDKVAFCSCSYYCLPRLIMLRPDAAAISSSCSYSCSRCCRWHSTFRW